LLAYYINLDRRPDRRAFMDEQFAALGLGVERLQATTPETINSDEIAPYSMADVSKHLSPPEIAISISHFRVWKRMLDQGRRRVFVLEDDLLLSRRLPAFLSAFESEANGVDILRLETHQTEVWIHPKGELGPAGLSLHLPLSFESGAGAYVMSATCAARILSSPERFSLPLDDLLFSPASPFRKRSIIRVAVPALALYRFEVSPDFNVPAGILTSDAHDGRLTRSAWKRRNKPAGLRRIYREIARLKSQAAGAFQAIWTRLFARRMIVPFADGAFSAPPSAARRRA
jgi:GR25 family glycosyltransferase involved in LPS biosynthesis